jgi:hypothetical protein
MPAACRQRRKTVTATKLVFTAPQKSKEQQLTVVDDPVLRVQGNSSVLVPSSGGPPSRALAGGSTMVHGYNPCSSSVPALHPAAS